MPPAVDLRQLQKVFDLIIERMVDQGIREVTLNRNYYWNVDSQSLFDTKADRPVTDIGSLHDDWEFLCELLDDKEQAVALMLTHLAPVVRYVGEKVSLHGADSDEL